MADHPRTRGPKAKYIVLAWLRRHESLGVIWPLITSNNEYCPSVDFPETMLRDISGVRRLYFGD